MTPLCLCCSILHALGTRAAGLPFADDCLGGRGGGARGDPGAWPRAHRIGALTVLNASGKVKTRGGQRLEKGTGHLSSRKCLGRLDRDFDSSHGKVWARR